ncbi:hypothetical protein D3C72_1116090 [compost metagenome]
MGEIIDIPKVPTGSPEEVIESLAPDYLDFLDTETPVTSDDSLLGAQARRVAQELHTAVYLKMGYITEEDLNENRVFIDKYADRSTYVVSGGKARLSACRYINANEDGAITSLPTIENFVVDLSILENIAQVDSLSDISYKEVVEVSGLVSVSLGREEGGNREEYDATQLMYAAILRESLERGHKIWILNTKPHLLRAFTALVGGEQVHIIGAPQQYMHITTVPAAMSPTRVIEAAMCDQSPYGPIKRAHLIRAMQGVDSTNIPQEMQLLLKQHGVVFR